MGKQRTGSTSQEKGKTCLKGKKLAQNRKYWNRFIEKTKINDISLNFTPFGQKRELCLLRDNYLRHGVNLCYTSWLSQLKVEDWRGFRQQNNRRDL